MIIKFHMSEISVKVPGPPGRAKAHHSLSTRACNRSIKTILFPFLEHPFICPNARQRSISLQVTPITCPPASAAPRETASIVPNITTCKDSMAALRQRPAKFQGFRVGHEPSLGSEPPNTDMFMIVRL